MIDRLSALAHRCDRHRENLPDAFLPEGVCQRARPYGILVLTILLAHKHGRSDKLAFAGNGAKSGTPFIGWELDISTPLLAVDGILPLAFHFSPRIIAKDLRIRLSKPSLSSKPSTESTARLASMGL